MRRAGLDALFAITPLNVYYATSKTLITERFGRAGQSAVLIPAAPDQPVTLIAAGFDVYFGGSDRGLAPGLELRLVGPGHVTPDAGKSALPMFPVIGAEALPAREQARRGVIERDARLYPDFVGAVRAAIQACGARRIGFDDLSAERLLESAVPDTIRTAAADLFLHIRAVKTPDEIALIRAVSEATTAAIGAALSDVREMETIGDLRRRIFMEISRRGATPVYGNIDGVIDEVFDEKLVEGQSLMLDIVAHLGFYQSDVGRTVFLGEPAKPAQQAARAIAAVWEELRETLRPGLAFSEIHARGAALLAAHDSRLRSAFNPHLVGLQHWDQPVGTIEGERLDPVLEEGMVLSVDCPLLATGVGGSVHVEDLMLIVPAGAAALHPIGQNITVV